jgi:hypothetical protein
MLWIKLVERNEIHILCYEPFFVCEGTFMRKLIKLYFSLI